MWNDSIHDQTFVQAMINKLTKEKPEGTFKTFSRMLGMLTVVSEVSTIKL
jgi:tRNA G26 N,N-dimethylase Trm1